MKAKKMDSEICRVCLKRSPVMVNIFDGPPELGVPISEMISVLAGCPVSRGDSFPESICRPCLENTKRAFKMKQTYERSQQFLSHDATESQKEEEHCKTELSKCDVATQGVEEEQRECHVKQEPLENLVDTEVELEDPYLPPLQSQAETETLHFIVKQEETDEDSLDLPEPDQLKCPILNEPLDEDSSQEDDHQDSDKAPKAKAKKKYTQRSGTKCSLSHCQKSKRIFPDIKLFKFPEKDPTMLKKWADQCRITYDFVVNTCNSNLHLCSDHFSPDDIGLKFLKKGAFPNRNLICGKIDEIDSPALRSPSPKRPRLQSPAEGCPKCHNTTKTLEVVRKGYLTYKRLSVKRERRIKMLRRENSNLKRMIIKLKSKSSKNVLSKIDKINITGTEQNNGENNSP